MKQLRKVATQPAKWVSQAHTLSSQQQTTEICATLKFEAKRQLGDRVPVSPKDFEKLNIILLDYRLKESLLQLDSQWFWGNLSVNFIKFIQSGGAA
ncbi:hypothetical protein Cri9333_4706 (plasmid) [Crinalium epipsammum PCC 9333]|uniref:Uncharacterized protein n=1 Tax=Crinalium epipsammum PCC 9333 TaxID=1173022 RepID=K9W7P5_9CYAN|nr:hypothetical protein [Crinalium epipsammum]AFZ15485.1 hypothetical protein Cri9333_4706 [Crinalium epipsammum PCC 9333]